MKARKILNMKVAWGQEMRNGKLRKERKRRERKERREGGGF